MEHVKNMLVFVNSVGRRLIERWKIAVCRIKAGIAMNNSSFVWYKLTHSCLMPCPKGVNICQEKPLLYTCVDLYIFLLELLPLHHVKMLKRIKIKHAGLDHSITRAVGSSDWKTRIRKYSTAD